MSFARYCDDCELYMIPTDDGIRCYCRPDALFITIPDTLDHVMWHCGRGDKADYHDIIAMLNNITIEMVDGRAKYGVIKKWKGHQDFYTL